MLFFAIDEFVHGRVVSKLHQNGGGGAGGRLGGGMCGGGCSGERGG